jgi:hypothetical protein
VTIAPRPAAAFGAEHERHDQTDEIEDGRRYRCAEIPASVVKRSSRYALARMLC